MNIRHFAAILTLSVLNGMALPIHAGLDTDFVPKSVRVSDPRARLNDSIIDPEIDSLNNLFCWSNRNAELWVGNINPDTGAFEPPDGEGELLADNVVLVEFLGNGPEWVFSDVGPQIVYTIEEDGIKKLARAFRRNGEWETAILPESFLRKAPIGSTDRGDTTPMIAYQGPKNDLGFEPIYVRVLNDFTTEQMIPTTDQLRTPGGRWAEGENTVVFTRPMPEGTEGPPRQVFAYDADTQQLEQLTFDLGNKIAAFMFNAPEYDGEQVMLVLIGEIRLGLYRYLDEDNDGAFQWTRVQIIDPPSEGDYIWSPEPFVYEGKTYISMVTSTSDDQQTLTIPTEIWLADLDPVDPLYRKLSDSRAVNRKDPETFIGNNGPYVYANLADAKAPPPDADLCPRGVCAPAIYRLDTGLGPQAQDCPPTGCRGAFSGWRAILYQAK